MKREDTVTRQVDLALIEGGTAAEIGAKVGWRPAQVRAHAKYRRDHDHCEVLGLENKDGLLRMADLPVSVRRQVETSNVMTIGEGSQAVYLYTTSALLRLGGKLGSHVAPDPVPRIAAQIDAGMPGKPHLLGVILTNDALRLEKKLHARLKAMERWEIGGGDEWFWTTREEIFELSFT
jgi:hypothetical protein